ncbi:hypothetical protein KUTeg_014314 [Tegillarca granosa]|uniref:GPR180/TMEM145 transmembrane domain-containing protein n=1 Tax=Tegillarca granosa TaxID=220873 RepID=A0ABQ9EW65_TEGGR|nr:hypothetical protein KUTeg_014314 [Tegillarca granosa]
MVTEVDVISNIDEWQTWPGYLILGFRLFIMIWFVIELRRTFKMNNHVNRLQFFQQFGAFFLVWFIYLPVLAIISTQFSALWKHKIILSISNAGDLLSYCVMIHLLWPSRSVLYLIKSDEVSIPYELEITGLLDDLEETEIFSKPLKSAQASDGETKENNTHNEPSSMKHQNGRVTKNGYSKPLLDDDNDM